MTKVEIDPLFSSPPCAMHEADNDAYLGYATKHELILALNELLEAERAGVRVALETAQAERDNSLTRVLHLVQQDESRWCSMLSKHIRALQGMPSATTSDFYQKAMAVSDVRERLILLNRGQRWVIKKISSLLPRVRDAHLNKNLSDMLQSHEANVVLTEGWLAS